MDPDYSKPRSATRPVAAPAAASKTTATIATRSTSGGAVASRRPIWKRASAAVTIMALALASSLARRSPPRPGAAAAYTTTTSFSSSTSSLFFGRRRSACAWQPRRRGGGFLSASSAAAPALALEARNGTAEEAEAAASRALAAARALAAPAGGGEEEDAGPPGLLDPREMCPVLRAPAALSPSSISEFLACPQSFLFQYVLGLKQPTNLALLRGRLCHSSLEQLFDLEPGDRNASNLHNLFRKNYREHRDEHLHLFGGAGGLHNGTSSSTGAPPAASASLEERAWGRESLQMLTNYLNEEDAARVRPARREVWVRARLPALPEPGGGPGGGGASASAGGAQAPEAPPTFLVRGIVDRIDLAFGGQGRGRSQPAVPELEYYESEDDVDDSSGDDDEGDAADPVVLSVVDYKTSQRPALKYSPAMNRKIRDQSFFQLQIYALLLHEGQRAERLGRKQPQPQQQQHEEAMVNASAASPDRDYGGDDDKDGSMFLPVRFLHLLYLNSPRTLRAERWTLDLGPTRRRRREVLDATRARLQAVHRDISRLVEGQDPRAFVGCARSFCYCHSCRPRFLPGTVWEPPPGGAGGGGGSRRPSGGTM